MWSLRLTPSLGTWNRFETNSISWWFSSPICLAKYQGSCWWQQVVSKRYFGHSFSAPRPRIKGQFIWNCYRTTVGLRDQLWPSLCHIKSSMTNKHLVLVEISKNYQLYFTPIIESGWLRQFFKAVPATKSSSRGFVCMVAWSMLAVEMLRLDMEVLKAAPCRFHFLKIAFFETWLKRVFFDNRGPHPSLLIDNHNTVDIYYVGELKFALIRICEAGMWRCRQSTFLLQLEMKGKHTHFSYLKIHSFSGVI